MTQDIAMGLISKEFGCRTRIAFERGRKNSTKQLMKDLASGKLEAQFGVKITRHELLNMHMIEYVEVRKGGDDRFAQYMANRRDIKIHAKATFFNDQETGVCFAGHFPGSSGQSIQHHCEMLKAMKTQGVEMAQRLMNGEETAPIQTENMIFNMGFVAA